MAGSYIPMDVIFDILQRLPLKSIMQFKSVCKDWCNLMKTHDFIVALEAKVNQRGKLSVTYLDCCYLNVIDDIHNPSVPTRLKLPWTRIVKNHSLDTFEVGRIVGSCNGLLCVCNSYDSCLIALCNPLTHTIREITHPFKKPPRAPPYCNHKFMSRQLKGPAIFGFGYDMRNNDYKIVTLNKWGERTMIYSLSSNSWTMSTQMPSSWWWKRELLDNNVHGHFYNNRLHWMNRKLINSRELCIICFDLSSEQWDELSLPDHIALRTEWGVELDLGVLDGCLCLFFRQPARCYDLETWVMKQYGVQHSWSKLATLINHVGRSNVRQPEMGHRSLAYSKSDGGREKIVLSKRDGLFWYDLNYHTSMRFELDPLESCCGFWPCATSLVSIPESNSMIPSNVVKKERKACKTRRRLR